MENQGKLDPLHGYSLYDGSAMTAAPRVQAVLADLGIPGREICSQEIAEVSGSPARSGMPSAAEARAIGASAAVSGRQGKAASLRESVRARAEAVRTERGAVVSESDDVAPTPRRDPGSPLRQAAVHGGAAKAQAASRNPAAARRGAENLAQAHAEGMALAAVRRGRQVSPPAAQESKLRSPKTARATTTRTAAKIAVNGEKGSLSPEDVDQAMAASKAAVERARDSLSASAQLLPSEPFGEFPMLAPEPQDTEPPRGGDAFASSVDARRPETLIAEAGRKQTGHKIISDALLGPPPDIGELSVAGGKQPLSRDGRLGPANLAGVVDCDTLIPPGLLEMGPHAQVLRGIATMGGSGADDLRPAQKVHNLAIRARTEREAEAELQSDSLRAASGAQLCADTSIDVAGGDFHEHTGQLTEDMYVLADANRTCPLPSAAAREHRGESLPEGPSDNSHSLVAVAHDLTAKASGDLTAEPVGPSLALPLEEAAGEPPSTAGLDGYGGFEPDTPHNGGGGAVGDDDVDDGYGFEA